MSSSQSGNKDKNKEDLDVFLTNIESKLRGPFSSLDLSKAVTTSALRKTMTPPQYLQNLNQVLLRTDKVSQLRILIGLLGLEPEQELDEKVLEVLTTAQEDSDEPWVKVIAGLIQGIMFKTEDDDSRMSCRGEYAKSQLDKAANDIIERVIKCMRETKELNGGEYPPDFNAHYIPFKYSMVSEKLREQAQVEPFSNPHFTVNWDADILKVDERLEAQRAKEAQEHAPLHLPGKRSGVSKSAAVAAPPGRTNLPAGFKPANLVKKATTKSTSSMFVKRPNPALKSAKLAGRAKLARRKGGAQSLVKGTSFKARTAMAAKTATSAGAAGASSSSGGPTKLGASKTANRGRYAASKAKMKMLDVSTVSNLHQQSVERKQEEALSKMSKKRRILEAAKLQGLKRSKPNEDSVASTATATVNAAAAQPAEEPQARPPAEPTRTPAAPPPAAAPPAPTPVPAPVAPPPQHHQQPHHEQEWEILLRERSNKLSDQDRLRVQQFFENQYNPTPEQLVYKMKLHEQRSVDPTTGKNIKETFYLELDYEKNSSKQSKKIKRY